MGNIPSGHNDRIAWFEDRIETIKATPAAFGVTAGMCTAADDDIKDARGAYDAVQKARMEAKDATVSQTAALRDMNRTGGDLVRAIRTFADNQPTLAQRDAVYAAASMTPPAPPSPAPAPNTPTAVAADPNANGTVTIKWKATGNNGAVYIVFRKLAGNNQFTQVGLVSTKKFIDATVPAGTTSCQYQVQAVRNNQTSTASQPVSVQFGATGASGFTGGSGSVGLAA